MNDETKKVLWWVAGIAAAIFVIFLWPHTNTWDGDGSINAFPSGAESKNYRLDATMSVTEHKNGWLKSHDEYSDIQGEWPDGGTFDISDCTIKQGQQSYCTDQDGKGYQVEVQTAPDPPETDDDSGS
jgi:hypothetical protein